MKKGTLSREEAIELAGIGAVKKVELLNCEPTSRAQTDGDNDIEYAASIKLDSGDILTAYYYMDGDWYESLEDSERAEELYDWEINGYEIN